MSNLTEESFANNGTQVASASAAIRDLANNGTLPQGAPRPLAGIRVLDLTRLLPGAYCTQMLADLGAEVTKVEQPEVGDYWRWTEPRIKTQSYQFVALNRGKRSVTLDLKNDLGRDAFLRLCENADVVVEGFRPGVLARLGLAPDLLRERSPRLIVCSMSGFGQTGEYSQVAAHDLNYQGLTGLLHYVQGSKQELKPTALPIADLGGGALMAIAGILSALVERAGSNVGRWVDVSVHDGLLSWLGFMTSVWNVPGHEKEAIPFDIPFNKPFYTTYRTADNRHMVVGAYEPKFWQTLCSVLGLPEWIDRQWATGADEEALRQALAQAFEKRSQAEWISVFSKHEACVTPVLTVQEAMNSQHARDREVSITVSDPNEGTLGLVGCPIRFDGLAPSTVEPSPPLGNATDAVLFEAGFSTEHVQRLREAGAI